MDTEHNAGDDMPRVKRFKHQSYQASLKDVHLPSALSLSQAQFDHEITDNESHFHDSLDHWRQLNLSPAFLRFANKADGLSASMPLLLHHWKEVVGLWVEAMEAGDDESLAALLDLLQKLIYDLRMTLLPSYNELFMQLLALLRRSIPAQALTALLATLSALFKYLLIPSTNNSDAARVADQNIGHDEDEDLLKTTWNQILRSLPRCNVEVQRAVGEVWGVGVLRRVKGKERERAVGLLTEGGGEGMQGKGVQDFCAWCVVSACKSISQTLHTSTTSIIGSLLTYHLSSTRPAADSSQTHTLIRRVLTALIHHCKSRDEFAAVGDLVVERFCAVGGRFGAESAPNLVENEARTGDAITADEDRRMRIQDGGKEGALISGEEVESVRRVLEVVSVPCSVRQGSRMSQKQLSTLASELPTFLLMLQDSPVQSPADAQSLVSALLRCITALLTAGDMALWLGPGRKILVQSWDVLDPAFAARLHGALAEKELGWGGWKVIGLQGVLKATGTASGVGLVDKTVGLLAALVRDGRITAGDVDAVWRDRIGKWAGGRLSCWEGGEESEVEELTDILSLAPFIPSLHTHLIKIISRTLETSQSRAEIEMEYAATHANVTWALGSCMHALAKTMTTGSPAQVKEMCEEFDLAGWVEKIVGKWAWSGWVLSGLVDIVKASPIDKELLPLSTLYPALQDSLLSHSRPVRLSTLRLLASSTIGSSAGEREVLKRCLQGEEVPLDVQGVRERVLRIGRVGQVVKDGDERGADICARWLVAQLKVNLRPLWSPAAEALASLSRRFGDLSWGLMFGELRAVSQIQGVDRSIPSWMVGSSVDAENTDDEIDEEERTWRDPSAHKLRSAVGKWMRQDHRQQEITRNQKSKERLDHNTYESQLLVALGESFSLAEKHNRDLVPFFLSFAGPESSSKLPRFKLNAWLTLFSKFTNPKALHSTDVLHSLYLSLLSHPDRSLQRLSLTCLLAYKSAHLSPHEDQLTALLDDTRWREELTALDMSTFQPQDRPELVDVIIRLLFGMMLEKRGRSRGVDRRAAILGALGGSTDQELELLVDLMLRPMESDSSARREGEFALRTVPAIISEKQQVGYLTLLGDVLKNLGPRLIACWPALLGTTIDLLGHSQSRIDSAQQQIVSVEVPEDEADMEELDDVDESGSSSKITRSVRQLGLKRFADFFRNPGAFDFAPYMRESFRAFISPRLPTLDRENTQAPSALLELFYAWTLESEHVRFLIDFDSRTLSQVYACLVATNVKPAVISRVFDIVDRILAFATDEFITERVIKPHASLLLTNLALLVERTQGVTVVSSPLGQRQIGILSEIAQYLTDATQAATLLGLFSPLLRKPLKLVAEKVKVNLLKITSNLLPLIPDLSDRSTHVFTKIYDLLARLFQSLRSSQARIALVTAFHRLAQLNPSLQPLAGLLGSLNAYSARRIDEPNFDCRLDAFAALNETLYISLSKEDWLPVLYNMLSFIQDANELAVRTNASYTLKRFVDLVASSTSPEYEAQFLRMLYPGLKNGLRSKNELVRAEVLGVIAYAVTKCDRIDFLREMQVLLAGGDEEANFFNNIHHVQIHRRTRALRRLGDQCDEHRLRSTTLADIFVPLVSNYIVTAASLDHHLVNEAIITTGRMAKQLAWGAYYALVQRYLKSSRDRDESERVYVRTLVAVLENFHFPMEEIVPPQVLEAADVDDAEDDDSEPENPSSNNVTSPLAQLVDMGKIADAVNLRLLPNLLHHLEKRDVTEDSLRIPISIGIVKVAKHLPEAICEPQIARLLTILSQILRSKSQETRDLTRDTLCRIAVILGSSYLPIMMREMRGALLRGPQLHVLAYVAHALLAYVTTAEHVESFQALDGCVGDVAHVSAEVVFGESGKDVQSEDFKTKMREVRSSSAKGLDSFAIMAKYITPSNISGLLCPLRSIMQETQSVKTIQLVDEVLRRVASGLNSNRHLAPAELLVLCHTLIGQNARFLKEAASSRKRKGALKGDAIVQIKRQVTADTDHYGNNSFRFVVFGLDLFNTAFRRSRFDFKDAAIMARLEPMVPVIGNTLYSNNAMIITSGMKAAASIVKAPLKTLDKSLPVFIRQIIDIVKQTGSTESDTVQTAFKSLATILRDCPAAQVKEKDLVYLLELLSPDLEDPVRQTSVFAMLRAIVSRKFVVHEIYDLMDKVSEIMVTNQSNQVQELCRSVLLQFLLDYPQGKGRLRNQMTFLAKNLSYVYESGRKSVMELLEAIVHKFEIDLVREYADLLFVGLVMVIANDDSTKCTEMAAELIKNLISRLDGDHRRIIMSHLHSWASQHSHPQLARVSSQVYGLIIDILQLDSFPYVANMLEDANAALERSKRELDSITAEAGSAEVELEWQVPYHALVVISKVLRVFPSLTAQPHDVDWDIIVAHLLFPHAWVRMASCRLLGILFTAVPITAPRLDLLATSPFSWPGMREVAQKLCSQLKSEYLDAPLSLQIVKNILYIGKCFYAMPVSSMDDGDEEANNGDAQERNPLPWLFSKLSYQVRSAHIGRRNRSFSSNKWSHQPLSILRWFAAMASYMDPSRLEDFLVHILSPVYRITEDDTIRDAHMDELKTLAVELQDLVQSKVGTTKFANVYSRIRQSVLSVRRDRRTARVMQATNNPEASAKRKLQRNSIKKDSRKRKNAAFADNKGRIKRRREE